MFCKLDESIIKNFSIVCFIVMIIFFIMVIILEILGQDGSWLANKAFEFTIYGVFSFGIYKIIILLNQLVGEMKFFRHHYILKDKKKKDNE